MSCCCSPFPAPQDRALFPDISWIFPGYAISSCWSLTWSSARGSSQTNPALPEKEQQHPQNPEAALRSHQQAGIASIRSEELWD